LLATLGFLNPVQAEPNSDWTLFSSYSLGYTHYQAGDLNDIMKLLANQSADAGGLNRYDVDQFDGHPRQALVLGFEYKFLQVGLEGEFWVEDFKQQDVPFYTSRDIDPAFEDRTVLSCDDFRQADFVPYAGGSAGCLRGQEVFTIIPLTLQLGFIWQPFKWSRIIPGYGIGVLAGDARVIVETDFIGANARPDDRMEVVLWPGVNLVQKFFLDMEFKPSQYFGVSWRSGWRISEMDYVEIRQKQGDSFLFGMVLSDNSEIEEGNRVYIQRNSNTDDILVIRDAPTEREKLVASRTGSFYDQVQGDFTGWFLELKVNAYWGL
jgi:hypothetical protein